MTWLDLIEQNENARLEVKRKLDGITIARLEVTFLHTIYYQGEGKSVGEALESLNVDINDDHIDPMEPDYAALAAEEPMTSSAQLRMDSGVGQ